MTAKVFGIGAAALAMLSAGSAGASVLDLSHDIAARGAKPAWTLKVSHETQFTLTRPGKPVVQASAPGAAISPGVANWTAKTADGQVMKITVESRACTLAGKAYPMAAQVTLGAETLTGCADHVQ